MLDTGLCGWVSPRPSRLEAVRAPVPPGASCRIHPRGIPQSGSGEFARRVSRSRTAAYAGRAWTLPGSPDLVLRRTAVHQRMPSASSSACRSGVSLSALRRVLSRKVPSLSGRRRLLRCACAGPGGVPRGRGTAGRPPRFHCPLVRPCTGRWRPLGGICGGQMQHVLQHPLLRGQQLVSVEVLHGDPCAQVLRLDRSLPRGGGERGAGFDEVLAQPVAALPGDRPGRTPGGVDGFECVAAFLGEGADGGTERVEGSESRRCRSGGVAVFVDDAAEDSGA